MAKSAYCSISFNSAGPVTCDTPAEIFFFSQPVPNFSKFVNGKHTSKH